MTCFLIPALALLSVPQDPPDHYKIRLTFDDKDTDPDKLGHLLKRRLADFAGIKEMRFDAETRILSLTVEMGATLSRLEIEEALPRPYRVGRFEVVGLPGVVERVENRVELSMPGAPWKFLLLASDATRDWFEAPEAPAEPGRGWAVSGVVSERISRRGQALELEWTVETSKVEAVRVPRTRAQAELEATKEQSIVVRVFLEDPVDGQNSGAAAAAAVKRIEGVVDAEYDDMSMMLTMWLSSEKKIDVEKLRAATREHATASRIFVDGLYGSITARTHGPYLRTLAGMEFRIEGKTDDVRDVLRYAGRAAEKMLFRVSGEVILVEDKVLIVARTLRSAR